MREFRDGMKDGIPIGLGYISVSFTFGLMAILGGMSAWQGILISMTCLTSAGQFAGLGIMLSGGGYVEMALSQFVINLRYALMALSLSQKVDRSIRIPHRFAIGMGITDEIFVVAMSREKKVSKTYMFGLIFVPYIGWAFGTALGALFGSVLPEMVRDAMGIAIYAMFLAIILPKAREEKKYLVVILIAVALSTGFYYLPILKRVSSGFVIIICALVSAAIGAVLFPVQENVDKEQD